MSTDDGLPQPASLSERATRGVTWTGLSAGINAALVFIQTAVVANFVQPRDLGFMSMAMVVVGFAQLFADLGLSSAIVHRRDPTRGELATLYWTNIAFGLSLFVLIELGTWGIVMLFREPAIERPLRLLGVVFAILPFGQQHQFLLQKHLRFDLLAMTSCSGYLAGAVATIGFAIAGWGVYALVTGQILNVVVRTLLLVTQGKGWRPSLHFDRRELQGYLGFGLYQLGDRASNYFGVYFVHAIIGALLGARVLGLYTLAFELVFKPTGVLVPMISRVVFPIFSMIREDAGRVKRGYLRVLRTVSSLIFPMAAGVAVMATLAITVIYGERWQAAAEFVQILAFVALLRSTGSPIGPLMLGLGRADWGFRWSAITTLIQIPGLYLGIRLGGATGVVWAFLLLQVLTSTAAYFVLVRPLIGATVREYLSCFAPSLAIAAAVAAVTYSAMVATENVLQPRGQLVACAVAGAIAFCALGFAFNREVAGNLKRWLAGRT
jgi:O-antigen/teichoic acid export membrane protein